MRRSRWHDAFIGVAITGIFALGVWALWWDDVRAILQLAPAGSVTPAGDEAATSVSHQT
jgi:hypothetical protein